MNQEILTILLSIAAAAFSGGIGILTIYLQKKWSATDLTRTLVVVGEVVRAAEIMGAAFGWDSLEKKTQAIAWAAERTGMAESELEAYVEAAVARLISAGQELAGIGGGKADDKTTVAFKLYKETQAS